LSLRLDRIDVIVFESEEAAKGVGEQVRSMAPDGVTIEDVEVREVVAHALTAESERASARLCRLRVLAPDESQQ
jgi:hypothetical protein